MLIVTIVVEGRWSGSSSPLRRLHKKTDYREDRMIVVTINNIWLKSYLSFVKWVADKMRSLNTLAIALNGKYYFSEKNIKNHSCFLSDILGSLSSTLTIQTNLSLSESSIIPAISEGIVVLNDLDFGFCRITLDVTSNNFILSYLSFVINIFVNILYILYPQSIEI